MIRTILIVALTSTWIAVELSASAAVTAHNASELYLVSLQVREWRLDLANLYGSYVWLWPLKKIWSRCRDLRIFVSSSERRTLIIQEIGEGANLWEIITSDGIKKYKFLILGRQVFGSVHRFWYHLSSRNLLNLSDKGQGGQATIWVQKSLLLEISFWCTIPWS